MTLDQAAWLAGLLEGEGCFILANQRADGKVYQYPQIHLGMTDEDVVRRAQAVAWGFGTLICKRPPSHKEHWKDQWLWRVRKQSQVVPLLVAIRPFMGQRRGAAIDSLLGKS